MVLLVKTSTHKEDTMKKRKKNSTHPVRVGLGALFASVAMLSFGFAAGALFLS